MAEASDLFLARNRKSYMLQTLSDDEDTRNSREKNPPKVPRVYRNAKSRSNSDIMIKDALTSSHQYLQHIQETVDKNYKNMRTVHTVNKATYDYVRKENYNIKLLLSIVCILCGVLIFLNIMNIIIEFGIFGKIA